jgi:hypothetical protein
MMATTYLHGSAQLARHAVAVAPSEPLVSCSTPAGLLHRGEQVVRRSQRQRRHCAQPCGLDVNECG